MIQFIDDIFNCEELNKILGSQNVVITDDTVAALYGKDLFKNTHLLTVPAGEASKTRKIKETLEDQMLSLGLGRDTCVIALGGGVITDLAGFVAATYCRGVPAVYIPTTLLAMVDAAIGGKTGVNTPSGKNLIGTITQPKAIFIDKNFLKTLPKEEHFNGVVEMAKHGLIADKDYFHIIARSVATKQSSSELDAAGLLRRKLLAMTGTDLIQKSIDIKKSIVEQDEHETGLRQLLNFGHTIGHAVETASNYKISHGQAVAIGIKAESYISNKLGLLPTEELNTITEFFSTPAVIPAKAGIQEALKQDKKSINKSPRFILLEKIGKPHITTTYVHPVENTLIKEAIDYVSSDTHRK